MYGSIPSFCWYAYFIWLGVQALEMDERSGQLFDKHGGLASSTTKSAHFIWMEGLGMIHTSAQVA